jgi:hypothetical protein
VNAEAHKMYELVMLPLKSSLYAIVCRYDAGAAPLDGTPYIEQLDWEPRAYV